MTQSTEILWEAGSLDLRFLVGNDGVVRLSNLHPHDLSIETSGHNAPNNNGAVPLFGVRLSGEGTEKHKSSKAQVGSYVSSRLKYQSHKEQTHHNSKTFDITSYDDISKISVTAHLTVFPGVPVVRSVTTIQNESQENIVVSQLSSLVIGPLGAESKSCWLDYTLSYPTNTWFREAQWQDRSLPSVGLDDIGLSELPDGHDASLATFSISNRGSFSTGTHLPIGLLKRNDLSETWLWQIESNGSWSWELGDFQENIYLAGGGPTSKDHGWKHQLSPESPLPASLWHSVMSLVHLMLLSRR